MDRSTRSGRVFASYMPDPDLFEKLGPAEVIHTDIDIAQVLQNAMAAADRRACAREQGLPDEDNDESGWEDDVDSRPPSPLSELSSRPDSPSEQGIGTSTAAVEGNRCVLSQRCCVSYSFFIQPPPACPAQYTT